MTGVQWNQAHPQIDTSTGQPFQFLPQPVNTEVTPEVPDALFPATLANAPFELEKYVGMSEDIPDLVHRYYQEQMEIDGGKMDKYASVEDAKGLTMGYWHTSELPLMKYAMQYTLCDNFFHSAFGGSFLNHQYLVACSTPNWPGIPTSDKAVPNANGVLVSDGFADPDGNLINTCYTENNPHPSSTATANLVPNNVCTNKTIADEMIAAGMSWAWYSGGWTNALAGHPDPTFQFHHQPLNYYQTFSDQTTAGQANKAKYLLDESAFLAACNAGTLPSVSFVKPLGIDNEHPGYTDLYTGELHADSLIQVMMASPNYKDMLIIVTYDEHGGAMGPRAAPIGGQMGSGSRVPTILIGTVRETRLMWTIPNTKRSPSSRSSRSDSAWVCLAPTLCTTNPPPPLSPMRSCSNIHTQSFFLSELSN